MSKIFNVLIIGAGNIGALYDNPQSNNILTHAHAFKKHIGFKLLGFVDVNLQKAQKAAVLWDAEAFSTLEEAFLKRDIDVVVVAVSDEYHYSVLKELSSHCIKLVYTEKPLTKTVVEGSEIIDLFKKEKIPVIINYSRRFVPEFLSLKTQIKSNSFGKFLNGSGYYGKGTLHNGSHMVDLLLFLFENIKKTKTVSQIFDHYIDDPSCSAILTTESGGHFFMQAIDCRHYSVFELDLFFEKKRVRILESGFKIEYFDVSDNLIYSGYHDLKKVKSIDTNLINAISYASNSIYKFLTTGLNSPSLVDDSLLAQRICSAITDESI